MFLGSLILVGVMKVEDLKFDFFKIIFVWVFYGVFLFLGVWEFRLLL